ncbi:MAG: hypothetical protein NC201_02745 [Prevotella sp.]|nr:hypothetical protein [Bacteroides sp.]MCM1366143.1 hypothetical protein [Prevotella sp.]MCM1436792.1 hypothetical protein [Prevotella sp.]
MNYRCHHCGQMNSLLDINHNQNQPVQCFCQHCGSPNIVGAPENTLYEKNNEATLYNTPPQFHNNNQPTQQFYPPKPQKQTPAFIYILIGLIIALLGIGAWYLISQKSSPDTEITQSQDIEENQESFVQNFYEECVFGNPTVRQIKDACSPRMLAKIKETDTRFALYKFLSGKNTGSGNNSKVTEVISMGDNTVRVSYIDNGIKGSSLITLVQNDDKWKIDNVEFLEDISQPVVKEEIKEKEITVTSDTYSFEGDVDGYNITGKLTFTPNGDGYDVTGKYAYYTTLEKYGDKKTSWIKVNGKVDKYNNIHWAETISGNPDYDSKLNGQIDSDLRTIRGSVGSIGDHTFYMSR